MKKFPLSFQLKAEDFLPASDSEKQELVVMRDSVSFWKDGLRRLLKNKVAMVSLAVIVIIMFLSFVVPSFYPYSYEEQQKGAENLRPMTYSPWEQEQMAQGKKVFPHFLGTDKLGRDYAVPSVWSPLSSSCSSAHCTAPLPPSSAGGSTSS